MSLVNTDGSVHPKVIYDSRTDRPANAKKAPMRHRKAPNNRVCSICPTKS